MPVRVLLLPAAARLHHRRLNLRVDDRGLLSSRNQLSKPTFYIPGSTDLINIDHVAPSRAAINAMERARDHLKKPNTHDYLPFWDCIYRAKAINRSGDSNAIPRALLQGPHSSALTAPVSWL